MKSGLTCDKKELTRNQLPTRKAKMDCTPGSKQRESVVRVAAAYAQAMAERLYDGMREDKPVLEEMEKSVLAELHGLGNQMLS
jgi:hypothetical protein